MSFGHTLLLSTCKGFFLRQSFCSLDKNILFRFQCRQSTFNLLLDLFQDNFFGLKRWKNVLWVVRHVPDWSCSFLSLAADRLIDRINSLWISLSLLFVVDSVVPAGSSRTTKVLRFCARVYLSLVLVVVVVLVLVLVETKKFAMCSMNAGHSFRLLFLPDGLIFKKYFKKIPSGKNNNLNECPAWMHECSLSVSSAWVDRSTGTRRIEACHTVTGRIGK